MHRGTRVGQSGHRNRLEHPIEHPEKHGHVANRYEKTAVSYLAMSALAAIRQWLDPAKHPRGGTETLQGAKPPRGSSWLFSASPSQASYSSGDHPFSLVPRHYTARSSGRSDISLSLLPATIIRSRFAVSSYPGLPAASSSTVSSSSGRAKW